MTLNPVRERIEVINLHRWRVQGLNERREGILVVEDRKAAILALAELGRGHVAHDLWLQLRDERLVDPAQFEQVCQVNCKDQSKIPLRCITP